jgi:hypothetical protein
MNHPVRWGVGLSILAIAFQMWNAEHKSGPERPTPIQPPSRVQKLEAGSAPNSSSGSAQVPPVTPTGPIQGCPPVGGVAALGDPTYNKGFADVRVDTDGGTQYHDKDHLGQTSSGNNSDTYAGVVLTKTMAGDGIKQGDLFYATNNQTGAGMWARVYDANFDDDKGISHGDQGEISDYLATQLGIPLNSLGENNGTNPITLTGYAGTSGIAQDCSQAQQNQTAQVD